MISETMQELLKGNSVIRAMFEEGRRLAAEVGADRVFDFSLGNPSVAPPEAVRQAIEEILAETPAMTVHGYMSNMGFPETRAAVAQVLNRELDAGLDPDHVLMTVGAAGAMNVAFRAILNPGDEVIVFAPFFAEYRNYVANFSGRLVAVPPRPDTLTPDLDAFRQALSPNTKAVILNSPNNPTGVVYSQEVIEGLCDILQTRPGVYLISDEPYRKLVYEDVPVPYVPKFYKNTLVAYSYSKALSLPGERIGYLAVSPQAEGAEELVNALTVANRVLGFVNAPSLMQMVIARCGHLTCDLAVYRKNRDLLYSALTGMGFRCVKPGGAFYLYPQTPDPDDGAFCQRAKAHNLLLVPGRAFGYGGHFRLAYCTAPQKAEAALPAFEALAKEYFQ